MRVSCRLISAQFWRRTKQIFSRDPPKQALFYTLFRPSFVRSGLQFQLQIRPEAVVPTASNWSWIWHFVEPLERYLPGLQSPSQPSRFARQTRSGSGIGKSKVSAQTSKRSSRWARLNCRRQTKPRRAHRIQAPRTFSCSEADIGFSKAALSRRCSILPPSPPLPTKSIVE